MDAENVQSALDSLCEKNQWDEYDFKYEMDSYLKNPEEVRAEVVTIQYVDGEPGGEDVFGGGVGEIYHIIKVSTDTRDQYFKKSGMYHSYAGSEWDDAGWVEVRPKEKKVTVYE